MPTNRKILSKGISYMSWALPALFIGPAIIHFAFINKLQTIYWLILSIGILVCLTGMALVFLGIKTIIKSMFDK